MMKRTLRWRRAGWPAIAVLLVACGGGVGGRGSGGGSVTLTGIGGTAGGSAGDDGGDGGSFGDDGGDGATGDGGPGPAQGCDGSGAGDVEFSYIWIANSDEGTVSKIDTRTGTEQARYITGPNAPAGSPSRTSVNEFGDAVVVDRLPGGITKISAVEERCVDANGDGAIQTSSGPGDVLPWGSDECVLWRTEIPSPNDLNFGPRPVAWEGAIPAPDGGCDSDVRVWVSYLDANLDAVTWRLDGKDGAVLDEVVIPWDDDRPYGGAMDRDGDFWFSSKSNSRVVEIDGETLDTHVYDPGINFYGVSMDAEGDFWGGGSSSSSAGHFHVDTGTWVEVATPGVGRIRGIMADKNRHVWGAGNDPCALVEIDGNTDTVVDDAIVLPGCEDPVGVSIDVDGYVWVVDRGAELAYKVDPTTHDLVLTVDGLVGPYTYSDMTGAGLSLVINPAG